jgi:hypothetical protein
MAEMVLQLPLADHQQLMLAEVAAVHLMTQEKLHQHGLVTEALAAVVRVDWAARQTFKMELLALRIQGVAVVVKGPIQALLMERAEMAVLAS